MKNKIHLLLALACVVCFSTSIVAQDVDTPEKPKAAKKAKGGKEKMAVYMRAFGSAELTDAQKKQLAELVKAKKEEMSAVRTGMTELVSKEDAKTIRSAVRKSMREGMDKPAAQKAALEAVGLSAEDQAKVAALMKQRAEIEQEITNAIVATFSEEQKEAMKVAKKSESAKGKKGKKGKKKKAEDVTSLSLSLPAMA